MRPLWLVLPLLFALTACDDPDHSSDGTSPAPESASTPSPQAATEAREGIAGIWRPQGESTLNALVLENDGQLYLVGDQSHRGVRWEKQDEDTVTLHYLDTQDSEKLNQAPLTATLENPSLTLAGDSPLAGDYRRDASDIGTLEGRVVLPDDAVAPDTSVLVLALRDQTAPDTKPVIQRLTRLVAQNGEMAFRLYFNRENIDPAHRYTVDARVILDGAVQFTTTAPHKVLGGDTGTLSLALHTATADAPFADTYWKLLQVGGEQTPPPQRQNTQAHLVFHSDGQQVKGSNGCNSLSGGYENDGDRLTLKQLASTKRACSGPNQAPAFGDALDQTRRFEIQGQRLTLYGEEDRRLAVLQAEYLF